MCDLIVDGYIKALVGQESLAKKNGCGGIVAMSDAMVKRCPREILTLVCSGANKRPRLRVYRTIGVGERHQRHLLAPLRLDKAG